MPILLAHAIEDSTDIFGISGGGFEHPKPPPGYATGHLFCVHRRANHMGLVVNKWHCDRFHSEYGFPLSIIIQY